MAPFASPSDFNAQLGEWVVRANTRTVRSIQGRPVDLLEVDYQSMLALPPLAPPIGLTHRVRLGRDYYVRVDTVDYSVDPRAIGRFVDVTASPHEVTVVCDGQIVASHVRSWAKHQSFTDPALARIMVNKLRKPSGDIPRYYQIVIKVKFTEGLPTDVAYVLHRDLSSL